ncbi:hypothetical protein [Avibacterium paragallinarum]|uniref:Probable cI repressor n=1 Tax=Avibacterium paragallinarum TaxID=728 RepID=A0A377I4D2_AVIPA|nr:hypothetical protein [Avibacterium paragallinarum]POY46802.1 hypothetical protein C3364_05590 [Avibacterium paragallinarum]RZN74766.1 hypothetical protein EC523_11000 [Avibacterium paragallinarum]STO70146.1 probable cI repressor [Avibacterium paragallinarum]
MSNKAERGLPSIDFLADIIQCEALKLVGGELLPIPSQLFNRAFLPSLKSVDDYQQVFCLFDRNQTFFLVPPLGNLIDGCYLIKIGGVYAIRHLTLLPDDKVMIDFEQFFTSCRRDEIEIIGKAILKMEKM